MRPAARAGQERGTARHAEARDALEILKEPAGDRVSPARERRGDVVVVSLFGAVPTLDVGSRGARRRDLRECRLQAAMVAEIVLQSAGAALMEARRSGPADRRRHLIVGSGAAAPGTRNRQVVV